MLFAKFTIFQVEVFLLVAPHAGLSRVPLQVNNLKLRRLWQLAAVLVELFAVVPALEKLLSTSMDFTLVKSETLRLVLTVKVFMIASGFEVNR